MKSANPLVTFALFAYNQERFIREAIDGAFSQNYSPLEIILSDDRSSDQTSEIMQEMVEKYEGQHRVILNRNLENLGIGAHVNKIFDLANGSLIVFAAGDDISRNDRVEIVVNYWLKNNKPSAIQSGIETIGADGEVLEPIELETQPEDSLLFASDPNISKQLTCRFYTKLKGCALSYSPEVYSKFEPLDDNLMAEDNVLAFRASLLDGVLFICEPLVKWRRHDMNLFGHNQKTDLDFRALQRAHKFQFRQKLLRSKDYDASISLSLASRGGGDKGTSLKDLQAFVRRKSAIYEVLSNWWELPLFKRIWYWFWLILEYGDRRERIWSLKRLMPKAVFQWRHSSEQ